ncbi:CPBP family intramembrane metalloprotease [Acidobacteriia bacterium AH_259_A11_L15]|nr:CPBP family intramembrane metalloprotease [Acidobacteriia bacterium AH_259_A11_L15]
MTFGASAYTIPSTAAMATAREARRGILVFLLLTFALSSIFYYLILSAGRLSAGGGNYVLGLMWSPGMAALLTRLLFQRNLRGQGWGWGRWRYQLLSYALPLLYAAVVYIPIWLTGLGAFNPSFFDQVALRFGWEQTSQLALLLKYLGFAATVGVAGSCLSALGEELGWRGFLVPELMKLTSFSRTCWLSGAIWALWHYPVLLLADYRGAGPLWYSLLCFTVMVLGISFLFAWMRLKSGSVWTGMFLHATHNLFIQGVFDPLTADTGITGLLIGEFGVGLAIVGILVGYFSWRQRHQLPQS